MLAFDKAVISDPPFEAVIHTASPFHFNITDTKKDLLDPGKETHLSGENIGKLMKEHQPSLAPLAF